MRCCLGRVAHRAPRQPCAEPKDCDLTMFHMQVAADGVLRQHAPRLAMAHALQDRFDGTGMLLRRARAHEPGAPAEQVSVRPALHTSR
jgi:hypothetical protein